MLVFQKSYHSLFISAWFATALDFSESFFFAQVKHHTGCTVGHIYFGVQDNQAWCPGVPGAEGGKQKFWKLI